MQKENLYDREGWRSTGLAAVTSAAGAAPIGYSSALKSHVYGIHKHDGGTGTLQRGDWDSWLACHGAHSLGTRISLCRNWTMVLVERRGRSSLYCTVA